MATYRTNSNSISEDLLNEGIMFDGSSIAGWKAINESDMILKPDFNSAVLDPFTAQPSLILFCDIIEPSTGKRYDRDPRSTAIRAEEYLSKLVLVIKFILVQKQNFLYLMMLNGMFLKIIQVIKLILKKVHIILMLNLMEEI